MKVRLPIPVRSGESVIREAEVDRPKMGVIADTQKVGSQGDKYGAVGTLAAGGIRAFYKDNGEEIVDAVAIKSMVRSKVPYRSLEYVLMQVMLMIDTNDGIEGRYPCPRCGNVVIAEEKRDEEGKVVYDTRDFISKLDITYDESDGDDIEYTFVEPVDIVNDVTKEVIVRIESITLEHPKLIHCIASDQKYGERDAIRHQCGIYVEALKNVNGKPVDAKWKNNYGMAMFNNIRNIKGDLVPLTRLINQYGIRKELHKECPRCGKEWSPIINTSNFFDLEVMPM